MDRKKMTLLLVDDNFMMIKMMIPMLEQLGFAHFVTAEDGVMAWQKLNGEQKIDLVLSDLIMPNMNGTELLTKIRNSEKFWDLPFVMITGEEHQNNLMNSIEVDVNSYILKPFTPDKLESEISAVIKEKYDPSPYQIALSKGRELLAQGGEPAQILAFFQRAMELQPREADPYYFIAIVYERQGDYGAAINELKKAIALRQGFTRAYDLMGLIFRRQENYQAEKEILTAVTELSPDNITRNLNLGVACARTGDTEGVKRHLKQATRLATKRGKRAVYEKIFRSYLLGTGMAVDAEGVFRKYIDPHFTNPRLINKYALILKEYKAYETALYFFERIVTLWRTTSKREIPEEDMAVYFFNLAVVTIEMVAAASDEEKKEAYKKAVDHVNKALDCNPRHRDSMKLLEWLESRLAAL